MYSLRRGEATLRIHLRSLQAIMSETRKKVESHRIQVELIGKKSRKKIDIALAFEASIYCILQSTIVTITTFYFSVINIGQSVAKIATCTLRLI